MHGEGVETDVAIAVLVHPLRPVAHPDSPCAVWPPGVDRGDVGTRGRGMGGLLPCDAIPVEDRAATNGPGLVVGDSGDVCQASHIGAGDSGPSRSVPMEDQRPVPVRVARELGSHGPHVIRGRPVYRPELLARGRRGGMAATDATRSLVAPDGWGLPVRQLTGGAGLHTRRRPGAPGRPGRLWYDVDVNDASGHGHAWRDLSQRATGLPDPTPRRLARRAGRSPPCRPSRSRTPTGTHPRLRPGCEPRWRGRRPRSRPPSPASCRSER